MALVGWGGRLKAATPIVLLYNHATTETVEHACKPEPMDNSNFCSCLAHFSYPDPNFEHVLSET